MTTLDKEIQEQLNNETRVVVEGVKGESKDWSEHPFDCDPGFQEDFSHIISNE